jgi:Domain of unknown function (DUF1963)
MQPRIEIEELRRLLGNFDSSTMNPSFRDSLDYRPIVTKYDAAVALAHTRPIREDGDCAIEFPVLWSNKRSPKDCHTKFGGSPYMNDFSEWPKDGAGEPLLFLCQFFFEHSLVGDVSEIGLPGNLVQFYTSKESLARSAAGAKVVRVNAAMVVLRWLNVREGSRSLSKTSVQGIQNSTLPFEWSGEIFDPGLQLARSVANWKCTKFFKVEANQSCHSSTKNSKLFLVVSSLDIGFERSTFFKRSDHAKSQAKWPGLDTGPVLFGDLENVALVDEDTGVRLIDYVGTGGSR